jgi:hypothetical protein
MRLKDTGFCTHVEATTFTRLYLSEKLPNISKWIDFVVMMNCIVFITEFLEFMLWFIEAPILQQLRMSL